MTCRTTGRALSRGAVALAFVVALVALGGCSSDPNSIAEQAKKGDQKGYIAGNGAIAKKPVMFMGIDFRESAERGSAFVATQKMTYPSLTDESGVLILAFGRQAPTSPPSTLILDREGRVAGRVSGVVSAATLRGLIDDVLDS